MRKYRFLNFRRCNSTYILAIDFRRNFYSSAYVNVHVVGETTERGGKEM